MSHPRLIDWLSRAPAPAALHVSDAERAFSFEDLLTMRPDAPAAHRIAGRSVLIMVDRQIDAARALVALDGQARRMVLAPTDLKPGQVAKVVTDAEIDLVVTDDGLPLAELAGLACVGVEALGVQATPSLHETEWVLATSGTTGMPKLVAHTLASLSHAILAGAPAEQASEWGTFYDIRRYGGLQVFLRAMAGPASLVLSDPDEAVGDFLTRLAQHRATHVLGTPSHWRRALMSPALATLAPRYVRLSGEIADQTILDRLKAAFPDAALAHAYASTEGGVGFTVDDGKEGFPASILGLRGDVEFALKDGTLRVRSPRTAARYLGPDAEALVGPDGFVDTGDVVDIVGNRCHFRGRLSGVINVGGAKVQPEEVETVVNAHPSVFMSRVRERKNPILGALVEAEIVLREPAGGPSDAAPLKAEILAHCRRELAAHKVPSRIAIVATLPVTAGGKLARDPR